jgi:hypothetical protein
MNRRNCLKTAALFVFTGVFLASEVNAGGLSVNLSFDSSFTTSFGANTAQAEAAANYAAQQFNALFSDPVQVNITVSGVSDASIFGQSSSSLQGYYTYTQIRSALVSDAKGSNDAAAVASLPVNDPTAANGARDFLTTRAEAKALGLIASDSTRDGTIKFGAAFSWAFDPANRAVSGQYDFIGVVEHEISEVMGRQGITGANLGNGGPNFDPLDLFRYTAAGVRGASNNGGGVYFSINGGVTNLNTYNNAASNGLDTADWSGVNGVDAFNQYATGSAVNGITTVDLQQMDVIGWDLTSAVPEPSSLSLYALGAIACGAYSWRRGRTAC